MIDISLQPPPSVQGGEAISRFAALNVSPVRPAWTSTSAPRHTVLVCIRCGSISHESDSPSCPKRSSGGSR